MTYTGSCHCGRIAFEVEGQFTEVMECNCTICTRKGYLLWFVPRDQLRLKTSESALATYTFKDRVIQHHFCPTCGCAPFGEGKGPSGQPMAAVNVRCLDAIDVSVLKRVPFDGRSL
jgi:hypothetical protein